MDWVVLALMWMLKLSVGVKRESSAVQQNFQSEDVNIVTERMTCKNKRDE